MPYYIVSEQYSFMVHCSCRAGGRESLHCTDLREHYAMHRCMCLDRFRSYSSPVVSASGSFLMCRCSSTFIERTKPLASYWGSVLAGLAPIVRIRMETCSICSPSATTRRHGIPLYYVANYMCRIVRYMLLFPPFCFPSKIKIGWNRTP